MIAGTGGTTGIIYWKDQIGEARVDNVVDAIMQAYCDLAAIEGKTPAGGFHRIENASKHLSLGSDWDGAAYNAIDAAHVAAVTDRLRRKLSEDELANILGRNACRVIAQSLSGGTFAAADGLCSRYGDPATRHSPGGRCRSQGTSEGTLSKLEQAVGTQGEDACSAVIIERSSIGVAFSAAPPRRWAHPRSRPAVAATSTLARRRDRSQATDRRCARPCLQCQGSAGFRVRS